MNKCIVENCPNIDCVDFPKNSVDKTKSIESDKLENESKEDNYVCLEHLKQYNLIDNEGDKPEDDTKNAETNIIQTKDNTLLACRICTTKDNLIKTIGDSINDENIGTMIMLCCHPVIIDPNDGLPNMICSSCLKDLEISFNFRKKCLEADEIWTMQMTKKRKQVEDEDYILAKKKCLQNEIQSDIDRNLEIGRNSFNVSTSVNQNETEITVNEPPPLVPIERHSNNKNSIKFDDRQQPSTSKIQIIKSKNETALNLPKGITVKTSRKFESSTGQYSCILTHGLQESIFVMADEYLFTFGLLKGNVRHLRCVLPNCKAKAEQKINSDKYDSQITVSIPHNHRPPSEQLRKKHMFFHVMRKRMQHDKTLNIRSIYEQVCTQEPDIRQLVPLRNVINEICKHQISNKLPRITSFSEFYNKIEDECFEKLHFTNSNKQFYQERFFTEDGSMAIVFCNTDVIKNFSKSTLMYVDASFKIETYEEFKYQLVTVLVWTDDSYYPILYALVNKKTQEIFRKVFQHLHDFLAPDLRPHEIVTDYEINLYYALGETYLESHIGGSVFYYTQNLYKKICSLNLSRDLETNSNFRNLYHMMLMLPLLPVNTILDALNNIELQAKELQLTYLTKPIFEHIRSEWILNVTAEMFCVHRLENRINENVIAPFKKFRDYLLLFKGKVNQTQITIGQVIEKLIELESFLNEVYTKPDKKSFGRDLSSFQKKNVIRAWQYIETHPKININNFFQKVLGYIKCMENQLWIWGFYRYVGDSDDVLISGSNSSIYVAENQKDDEDEIEDVVEEEEEIGHEEIEEEQEDEEIEEPPEVTEYVNKECALKEEIAHNPTIVMEAVIDNDGGVVLQSNELLNNTKFEKAFFKFVRYE